MFALGWACVVAGGFVRLSVYGLTPGAPSVAPGELPQNSGLRQLAGLPTLIMVVHPDCPCSRASMSEFSTILAGCGSAVSANIVFVPPAATAENLASAELWQTATHLKAQLLVDRDGSLARRLGATTSGQVLLYDATDHLQFSGGITAARGHAGANAGRSAVESFIGREASKPGSTPVFGCELF